MAWDRATRPHTEAKGEADLRMHEAKTMVVTREWILSSSGFWLRPSFNRVLKTNELHRSVPETQFLSKPEVNINFGNKNIWFGYFESRIVRIVTEQNRSDRFIYSLVSKSKMF